MTSFPSGFIDLTGVGGGSLLTPLLIMLLLLVVFGK
mgnify:CR=1 FL=1